MSQAVRLDFGPRRLKERPEDAADLHRVGLEAEVTYLNVAPAPFARFGMKVYFHFIAFSFNFRFHHPCRNAPEPSHVRQNSGALLRRPNRRYSRECPSRGHEQANVLARFGSKVYFHVLLHGRLLLLRPSGIVGWRVSLRERLQFGEDRLGTGHADNFRPDSAVEEKNQHGDGLNPVDGSQVGIVVHVHFENFRVAVAGLSDFIQNRLDEQARFAPTGQKADHHRLRAAQNFHLEFRFIDFLDSDRFHFFLIVFYQLHSPYSRRVPKAIVYIKLFIIRYLVNS